MSLSLALNTALSGLRVNQQTMALISNNIANANTKGYSRQIVNLESVSYDGVGGGVRINDVIRKTDEYLQSSIYTQTGAVGYSQSISDYYDKMQVLLGDPGLGNSIDNHISTFFSDLQQMAETPERSSTRAAAVEAAINLSREISSLASGLEDLRFQADNEIADTIDNLNQRLKDLYAVNEAISEDTSVGEPDPTLLDRRDLLLEEISGYIDIKVNKKANGTVDVYAGNGLNLMDYGYSRLEYQFITDRNVLVEDGEINPIILQSLDDHGNPLGSAINLVSGGTSSEIEARFSEGTLAGLLAVRDQVIPDILSQLDQLSSQLRDSFNAIHNLGTSYPAATVLQGTALYTASERSEWDGMVRIAALNEDGTPMASVYSNESSGVRPLQLDLDTLYSGGDFGEPDVQTIIDEINHHFGIPQNHMSFGNLNNVELALVSDTIPDGGTPIIEFDFDIENISGQDGEFWIDDIQVLDDTGANITSVTDTVSTLALHTTSTFVTTAGNPTVTVRTALPHGLANGDMVRLNDPGVAIDGIPGSDFDGYFVISNVTANGFDITVATPAAAGTTTGVAAQTISPPYATIAAGQTDRLQQNGTFSANVAANTSSAYYDISVAMRVRDEDGTVSTTTVTYRVRNGDTDTMNDRVAARAVTAGSGTVTVPSDFRPLLRAYLADENGNELPSTAGDYGEQEGYLVIESMRDGITFAIEDVNTSHLGLPTDVPPRAGDGRGFSHHFGLNNFFENNLLTQTGDTVKNSAINLAVEQRFYSDPSLISTGNLQLSNQPADPSVNPLYTYERYSGDQSIAQQLAALGIVTHDFEDAGGMPSSRLTFSGYAGEVLGYIAANTNSASRAVENDEILLDGYVERADAISGVNLDEELANTIIYQNAYAASARVISVTDKMFETLLQSF